MSIFAQNVSVAPKSKNTYAPANGLQGRFKDLASSDPYQTLPRERTNWDKFLNFLGFRSGYDKAQEEYNLASAEYQAQLAQLSSEEQYNSPEEQARRMRQAGLNPDLTGVEGEPASEFDNQQESPNIGAGDTDITSIVGTVLDAFTGTTAIMKDIKSLTQMNQAIDSNDLDLASRMMDFLSKSSGLFKQYAPDDGSNPDGFDSNEVVRNLFGSNRNFNRFRKLRTDAENSLLGFMNEHESFSDYYDAREKRVQHESKPYWTPVNDTNNMVQLLRPLNQALFDFAYNDAKAKLSKAKLDTKTNEKTEEVLYGDGSDLGEDIIRSSAEAQVSGNRTDIETNTLKIESAKIYTQILKGLKEYSKDGDLGAQILSMLLGSKILGVNTFGPVGPITRGVKDVVGAFK